MKYRMEISTERDTPEGKRIIKASVIVDAWSQEGAERKAFNVAERMWPDADNLKAETTGIAR